MLTLKLGWRNLWRNRRRSLISIAALASALLSLMLMLAMSEGLKEQLVANSTGLLLSHAQLHHPDYLPDREIYNTLGEQEGFSEQEIQELSENPLVEASAPRAFGFALISTGEHSAGVQLIGVDPDRERQVGRLLEGLSEGQSLPSEPAAQVMLGIGLAREIQATLGSQVAIVTQSADGSLGNQLFQVGGILQTGLVHLDRSLVLLHLSDLQELLVLEQRYHELAIKLTDPLLADAFVSQMRSGFDSASGVVAHSWADLAPQLRDYLDLFEGAYGFIIGLVGIFAALGVLNTMLMAVFERAREIGTVGALGMSPLNIVMMIVFESGFLCVIGLIVGVILSGVVMQPLLANGIDLSRWTGEISLMQTHLDPIIHFRWVWRHVWWAALGLSIATLLASILPAYRAVRLNPVEALLQPEGG